MLAFKEINAAAQFTSDLGKVASTSSNLTEARLPGVDRAESLGLLNVKADIGASNCGWTASWGSCKCSRAEDANLPTMRDVILAVQSKN